MGDVAREVHDLDIDVLTSVHEFQALRKAWEGLYDDAAETTPFQSWAWLFSWWESYGSASDLRIITVRESGLLVGIMPSMQTGRLFTRRMVLIGTGLSDYLDVLARAGWEDRVCSALAHYLRRTRLARVVDLHQLRESATAHRLCDFWRGPTVAYAQANTPIMAARPWPELLAGLPAKRRETARRTMRRLDRDGLSWRRVEPEATGAACDRWLELHHEYWRGRSITPEHETARFAAHLRSAAQRLAESGSGALYELVRADSDVVEAADLLLVGKDFVMGYVSGATERLHRRVEVNTVLVSLWNMVALENFVPEVNLGRGLEPYKVKWSTTVCQNQRVALGTASFEWLGLATDLWLRDRLSRSAIARRMVERVRPLWNGVSKRFRRGQSLAVPAGSLPARSRS